MSEEKYMVFVFMGILVMVMVMVEVRGIPSTVTKNLLKRTDKKGDSRSKGLAFVRKEEVMKVIRVKN